jgi:hypothetical protein
VIDPVYLVTLVPSAEFIFLVPVKVTTVFKGVLQGCPGTVEPYLDVVYRQAKDVCYFRICKTLKVRICKTLKVLED